MGVPPMRKIPKPHGQDARATVAALLLICTLLSSCAWRIEAPVALDESLRVQVVADQGRLPRAGALLQSAVADAIPVLTGWRLRPDGQARLDLSIDADRIRASADDTRGVPVRWAIEVRGSALLVCRQATRTFRFSGTGYASGRDGEADALTAATSSAADAIARWLARVDLNPQAGD